MYDYYSIQDVKLFNFFMIPKELIRDKSFVTLSTDAKLLYGIMMERLTLSQKNGWVDDQGHVYIIYTIDTLMDDMNCKSTKAFKLMKELESFQLIERKRQGLSKPNLIYVKNYTLPIPEKQDGDKMDGVKNKNTRKASVSADIRECEGQDLREDPDIREREGLDIRKRGGHDVRERGVLMSANADPNKNNRNIINNIIISSRGRAREEEEMDVSHVIMTGQICMDPKRTENTLKTNLGYDQLVTALPEQRELTDQVFQVLTDLYTGTKPFAESVKINGMLITARELRVRLTSLTETKLYHMIRRLKGKEIINPSTYLISCLYNTAVFQVDHGRQERPSDTVQPFYNFEQRDLTRMIQLLETMGMKGGGSIGCAV